MLTLEKLADKMRPSHNHICILYDSELVRLIGVHEDEVDFYYVVQNHKGKIFHASAVGACVSLKDCYPADRYASMDNIFSLNGAIPVAHFQVTQNLTENPFRMRG